MKNYTYQWTRNIQSDFWAGLVVALALIPEAIAFSILAGVSPMVGLYSSFIIAISISFFGGRPAMISAATGAMSIVVVSLVKDYGLQYLLAATILTGFIQIIFGFMKVSRLMALIPNSVMIGFVNSLALLVFMAQLPHFITGNFTTWLFLLLTVGLIYLVPFFIKVIPAPLIVVVILSIVASVFQIELKTVEDMGEITKQLPVFLFPDIPLNLETLMIILPYSFTLAIVGLLESLLTASILDDMTHENSSKEMESHGQGISNIITGFFGGMAGCAMIGQSIINVRTGARGRFSTFVAGAALLVLILILGDLVKQIPMPVLAGVMIVVCITQFDWSCFPYMMKAPIKESFTLVLTTALVIYTHNLAIGVAVGVIVSLIFFVFDLAKLNITKQDSHYTISGNLFFVSAEYLKKYLKNEQHFYDKVTIDFSDCTIMDETAWKAIEEVKHYFYFKNIEVEYIGLKNKETLMPSKFKTDTDV